MCQALPTLMGGVCVPGRPQQPRLHAPARLSGQCSPLYATSHGNGGAQRSGGECDGVRRVAVVREAEGSEQRSVAQVAIRVEHLVAHLRRARRTHLRPVAGVASLSGVHSKSGGVHLGDGRMRGGGTGEHANVRKLNVRRACDVIEEIREGHEPVAVALVHSKRPAGHHGASGEIRVETQDGRRRHLIAATTTTTELAAHGLQVFLPLPLCRD